MTIRMRAINNLISARALAVAIVLVVGCIAGKAQTDAQLSQYFAVPTFYNPGAIGTTELLRIRAGSRMQWLGIDNAPVTFLATGDMPYNVLGKRIGVGLMIDTESQGLFSSFSAGAQFAYKLRKWGGEFSIGLQLGMYDQKFKGSEVFIPSDDDYHQSTDDAIPMRDIKGTAFDAAFGVWYNKPKFWAGLSCTHLTSPTISLKAEGTESTTADQNYEFQAQRTLYFTAGGNISLKNTLIELLPSVLMKTDFTFYSGDATLRARYNKMFSVGIGYRLKDAVYITLGAEIKDFFIGYAYDYSTSAIAKASSGSHEVFAGYSMKLDLSEKNKNKHKSIRIM